MNVIILTSVDKALTCVGISSPTNINTNININRNTNTNTNTQ